MKQRMILDAVVVENLERRGNAVNLGEYTRRYSGLVRNGVTPVYLNRSEYGLAEIPRHASLNKVYSSTVVSEGQCYIAVAGKTVEIREVELKVLRTLIMEQISKSEDYSVVVAQIVTQVLEHAINKKTKYKFVAPADYSEFKRKLFSNVVEFVCEKLLSDSNITEAVEVRGDGDVL